MRNHARHRNLQNEIKYAALVVSPTVLGIAQIFLQSRTPAVSIKLQEMEQLEIHSKSYLVRWVDVKSEHTISWSIQTHKKSINFGLFKHPGSGIAPTPKQPQASFEVPRTPTFKSTDVADSATSLAGRSAAVEKLEGIGLKLVSWAGSCDANQVATGTYDVQRGEGGMYACVFDNTFSKSFSKTVTFALRTYTTSAPPSNHHLQNSAAGSSQSLRVRSTKSRPKVPMDRRSSDSVPSVLPSTGAKLVPELESIQSSSYTLDGGNYFTGVLQKRRRKRGQGQARRFFILDFTTSTLAYYHDRNSLTIRGTVPLSLAVIATNPSTREFSIDSGAEVWHLKALNKKDFEAWQNALEFASKPYVHPSSAASPRPDRRISRMQSMLRSNPEEEREWTKVEGLVVKISASRDLAMALAKDTDPKYLPSPLLHRENLPNSSGDLSHYPSSTDLSPAELGEDYFQQQQERRSFWKRKTSGTNGLNGKRSVSSHGVSPGLPPFSNGLGSAERSGSLPRSRLLSDESLHERCMQLLHNLDSVVNEFSSLIAENKERRTTFQSIAASQNIVASRMSLDSINTQEFFDAEAGDSQLLTMNRESDEEAGATEVEIHPNDHDESSASELEDSADVGRSSILITDKTGDFAFPPKPRNLNLRSYATTTRRTTIPPATVQPPSLIGILRKNVGKDLSTISMPVSSNEPISLLQKSAEQLEYSELLDIAASFTSTSNSTPTSSLPKDASTTRLLYLAAFALSMLSEFRVKERSIRKPFNPLLGETYELIREDKGFRFFAEKVSHRPVRLACQADSERGWSLTQAPAPSQKFWGKSAELITEGKVRVRLHDVVLDEGEGECYSWQPPTCFLRNLIAGEKYVEPVGSMTVTCDTTGSYAVATFKAKGMFGGRSDEVTVSTFAADGGELGPGLLGKWTESLFLTGAGAVVEGRQPIWTAGALVPDATRCYGFTAFAASLNELSERDRPWLPGTDTRLRPDQRAAEEGDYEAAERLKGRLEERQRERRRRLEEEGREWE
ncbi:MAG: hypothetical protein LQ340_007470, partial [Diploschistes diacapsis]